MKVLKFAILTMFLSWPVCSNAGGDTFDLDKIETENGKIYHDILILDSDEYGLLFRHAVGIAKVDFGQLSMNLRMLYEPVGDNAETPGTGAVEFEGPPAPAPSLKDLKITVTARNRVTWPMATSGYHCINPCQQFRAAWPSHWSRYHPGLALAVPECRSLAVRDFLITSGLAARPPGVVTYQLPKSRPYLLY